MVKVEVVEGTLLVAVAQFAVVRHLLVAVIYHFAYQRTG